MWTTTFFLIHHLSRCEPSGEKIFGYEMAIVQAFTAASNNFIHVSAYVLPAEVDPFRECHGFVNLCGLVPRVPAGVGVGWDFVTLAQPAPVTWV